MKILFVTMLLAVSVLAVIISLDLIMGVSFSGVIWKAINPFRVMEPSEYTVVFMFIIFLGIYFLKTYLNKKSSNNSPTK
ncbi:hypothetical protein RCG23_15460 [Neobacillus sp. PS3-34]|uniref:hypothetical protein n=1 Tax=Neobacillus sp. PS3-34 TaxID=3070678 RepID=UPI0027E0C68E|nr:hypothetical protein [Neobacillus sp. PS3-34]WML46998.1 hypothetical protein RCG23_15460 [Neobacillus sp. PS3-34]